MAPALSVAQKQRIINKQQRRSGYNKPTSQLLLALWDQKEFKIAHPPHQATISRILSNVGRIMKLLEKPRTSFKKLREATAPRLELALENWI